MKTRRDFFRQFVGQVGVLHEELRGMECIPLNRLNELPENIIEQIEPVFFPEEKWEIKDNTLIIPNNISAKSISIELNRIEIEAIERFGKHLTLKQSADQISVKSGMPSSEIYKIVTSLFFRLASLRICHPKEAHPINDILNTSGNEHL
jgi:hypothetical protein